MAGLVGLHENHSRSKYSKAEVGIEILPEIRKHQVYCV